MAQMLTAKQVAEVKGCSPRYIKKIIQDGKLKAVETVNSKNRKTYLVPLDALDEDLQHNGLTDRPNTSAGGSHTVVSGDTLWGIAKKYYGNGAQYTKIYGANSGTIEAAAKSHGKSSSGNGHWIYPGTVLSIPA